MQPLAFYAQLWHSARCTAVTFIYLTEVPLISLVAVKLFDVITFPLLKVLVTITADTDLSTLHYNSVIEVDTLGHWHSSE